MNYKGLIILLFLALKAFADSDLFYPTASITASGVTFNASTPFSLNASNLMLLDEDGEDGYNQNKYKVASVAYNAVWTAVVHSSNSSMTLPSTSNTQLQFSIPANTVGTNSNFQTLRVTLNLSVIVTTKKGDVVSDSATLASTYKISSPKTITVSYAFSNSSQSTSTNSSSSNTTSSGSVCTVSPASGIALSTSFQFACQLQVTGNPRLSVYLIDTATNSQITVVSKNKGLSYSTFIPAGSYTPKFVIAKSNSDNQIIGTYYGSTVAASSSTNSSNQSNSSTVCVLDQLTQFADDEETEASSSQATLAINLLTKIVLNDSEMQAAAAICNISNISSWRSVNKGSWAKLIKSIAKKYGDEVDKKQLFKLLNQLSNPSITRSDFGQAEEEVTGYLQNASDSLAGLVSSIQGNNSSPADDQIIQSGFDSASNIWIAGLMPCSEDRVGQQNEVIGNLLRASSNTGDVFASDGVLGSALLLNSGSSHAVDEIFVQIPSEALSKCSSNVASLEISSSQFRSFCRRSQRSNLASNNVVIKLRDSNTGQECNVHSLNQNITFSLQPNSTLSDNQEFVCVWYDVTSGNWSSDGCVTVNDNGRVNCSCTHLTEFSLLVQAKRSIDSNKPNTPGDSKPLTPGQTKAIDSAKIVDSVALNAFFGTVFAATFLIVCHQTVQIVQKVAPENQKVILPAHLLILAICVVRVLSLVVNVNLSAIARFSPIGLLYWLSISLVAPIWMYLTLAGLCILSWVLIYHVNIKNQLTSVDADNWRLRYWKASGVLLVLTLATILSANHLTLNIALKIYQSVMFIFGSLSLALSIGFGVYGTLIFKQVNMYHKKISSSNSKVSNKNNSQVSAALRTRLAGLMFCFFWALSAVGWVAYATTVVEASYSIAFVRSISVIMHLSELFMMMSSIWLYKNAVPRKSTVQHSKGSKNKGDSSKEKNNSSKDNKNSVKDRKESIPTHVRTERLRTMSDATVDSQIPSVLPLVARFSSTDAV